MGTSSTQLYVLAELKGNVPTHLDTLQQLLLPFHPHIHAAWVAIWFVTLGFVLVKTYLEYRESIDS